MPRLRWSIFLGRKHDRSNHRHLGRCSSSMKGLIIDEPWISLILQGQKTWEMRKTACHHRGRIALIRKGSGQVVGVADLVDSLNPLTSEAAYRDAESLHQIPVERQAQAFADGWRTPWVLTNGHPLAAPVRYQHPAGAVIWVNLDTAVVLAVQQQSGVPDRSKDIRSGQVAREGRQKANAALLRRAVSWLQPWAPTETINPPAGLEAVEELSSNTPADAESRLISVTGGNVRNNHIYLPLDFFPADVIGGSNKTEMASRTVTVMFSPGTTVETDIDGAKRIFRARGAVADFFRRAGVKEGDNVRLINHGPYRYEISKTQ